MFLKSTEALQSKCELALEEGQKGEILRSLELLSSARWQRALMDETASASRDPASLTFLSDREINDLNQLVESIPRLEMLLQSLDGWTAKSFEDSEILDLLTSDVGLSLYIEHLLPKAWFYSADIAVLVGNHQEQLHRKLVTKGQRRFVIFVPSDQEARASLLNYLSDSSTTEDLLVSPEMLPTISDIKTLAGDTLA